mmetsp:Transcript_42363/g.43153  ORF Transcript_42363/g.43153 Transcript_42363/m.43153 type:complete len:87 (-) Transcript_42363:1093-1353(-)
MFTSNSINTGTGAVTDTDTTKTIAAPASGFSLKSNIGINIMLHHCLSWHPTIQSAIKVMIVEKQVDTKKKKTVSSSYHHPIHQCQS